jgi:hypothetical protein
VVEWAGKIKRTHRAVEMTGNVEMGVYDNEEKCAVGGHAIELCHWLEK